MSSMPRARTPLRMAFLEGKWWYSEGFSRPQPRPMSSIDVRSTPSEAKSSAATSRMARCRGDHEAPGSAGLPPREPGFLLAGFRVRVPLDGVDELGILVQSRQRGVGFNGRKIKHHSPHSHGPHAGHRLFAGGDAVAGDGDRGSSRGTGQLVEFGDPGRQRVADPVYVRHPLVPELHHTRQDAGAVATDQDRRSPGPDRFGPRPHRAEVGVDTVVLRLVFRPYFA